MPVASVSSLRPIVWATGVVALVLLAAWWAFDRKKEDAPPPPETATEPAPPDPRLTFATPFRNVKPHVAYVGDKVCVTCHKNICETYHKHPMGRSAALSVQAVEIERYDAAAKNPFVALERFEMRIEKQPSRVLHHIAGIDKDGAKQAEYSLEATIAIGSGARGRSYLSVRDGVVWQSPVSWFSGKGVWDISPGYSSDAHFQRPITAACLYCHTDQVEPVPNTMNRFKEPIFRTQANIGCERCHGPGELHVAERFELPEVDGIDTSIVHPKHLEFSLREAICQQCHLQGETRVVRRGRDLFEYRPGLPLELFVTVYQRHPNLIDYGKSVGQFEQLSISKCFTASKGTLGCTSCHDPHEAPTAEVKNTFFRNKCVDCHVKPRTECDAPFFDRAGKADNCVSCHMNRAPSTTIAHTAVTDHRILRDPAREPAHQFRPIPLGEVPLLQFKTGTAADDPAETERSLGIALSRMVAAIPATQMEIREMVFAMAESRLRDSVKRWPSDVPALEALTEVLGALDRKAEALTVFKSILALAPDREQALVRAVEPAALVGEYDFAAACASKAVELNPTSIDLRLLRARLMMTLKKYAEAEADCRVALRENPTHSTSRVLLAISLHHQGDTRNSQAELTKALSMIRDPKHEAALRNWFNSSTR
jgi:tetratricopeptide (TPR) repeat protein